MRAFDPSSVENQLGADGVRALAETASDYSAADYGSLLQQLSLHLPRFAAEVELGRDTILSEARRLARRLEGLRAPCRDLVPARPAAAVPLRALRFEALSDEIARPVLERFHYLLSFRPSSFHFGLKLRARDPWPVALVTLSPFDLGNARAGLKRCAVLPEEVRVVSRVFAFPAAPPNAISFLLARVRRAAAAAGPRVRALLTYVNPNLGFTGASYKADNWALFGTEGGTRYLYYRDNYVTDREALRRFGATFEDDLAAARAAGLTCSQRVLLPLLLYVRGVSSNITGQTSSFPKWHAAAGLDS
jgi:hypothetical protein